MVGLPEVIGLLYRADWTRLSLSAEWRSETDREPLPRLSREERSRWFRAWPGQRQDNGRYAGRGALLIGRIRAVADALTLASAQLAVAREYGFASRTRLRDEVTARTASLARRPASKVT